MAKQARAIPSFMHEMPVPAAEGPVQGGAAFSRAYAVGGEPVCIVMYNSTEIVLTDFTKGAAKQYQRDLQKGPAADCDAIVREWYSTP